MIKIFRRDRVSHKIFVWSSLVILLAFGVIAFLAPWLALHDPYEINFTQSSLPPMWVQDTPSPGSPEYPLGTDWSGRDILSRLIYGTRTAFFLAFTAVPLAILIGTPVGLVAGFVGGRINSLFMLFADMVHSLPGIMFMVIVILIFRDKLTPSWFHGLLTLIFGFAAISWVSLARLIRINVMSLKNRLFIEAAVSVGATSRRIITRHLLPNVMHVILVWALINIPVVILLEAILGYVGVPVTRASGGNEFTTVSWGGIFSVGRIAWGQNPLLLLIPAAAIFLLTISFSILGDYVIRLPEVSGSALVKIDDSG